MKKILLVALAAAAMVSCSQDEEIENAAQKVEIKIGTVVKAGTKAVVTDNTNFKAFKVHAYTVNKAAIATSGLGDAYIPGAEYVGGQGAWTTTSGTFYWPLNNDMQFFAYPTEYKDAYKAPATGYPTLDFTVGATVADQKDLVVAYQEVASATAKTDVALTFKHALTRINFSFKPVDASYIYEISEIKINDVKGGAAVYSFDGSWNTTSATPTSYVYPIANTLPEAVNEYIDLSTQDGSLMLLPQSVAGKTITIKYKTTKGDFDYFNDSKTVTLPEAAKWELGQNIRYKLVLPVGAESISFTTDVENLNSENGVDGDAE